MNEHYYDPVEIWSYEEREGAYKRIAELEADLKNARELIGMTPEPAFPAWIPVSERLPEADGYYLTYDKYGQCCDHLFLNGRWSPVVFIDNVTHWMPLPPSPEAK